MPELIVLLKLLAVTGGKEPKGSRDALYKQRRWSLCSQTNKCVWSVVIYKAVYWTFFFFSTEILSAYDTMNLQVNEC